MRFWLLLFWMVSTIVLTFSIIGLFLFIPADGAERSSWMEIGKDLLDINFDIFVASILFVLWVLFSIVLSCSVIGLLLFIPKEYSYSTEKSTWVEIGLGLKDIIIKK